MKTNQSQINISPKWQELKLASIFEFKNGLNKEKKYFGDGTPIINYTDVHRGGGLYKKNVLGKVEVSKSEINRFNVKKGDVFFTRTSETIKEIGFSAVALEDFEDTVFSGFVLRARPKGNLLTPGYSQYYFKTNLARKEIMEKSSFTTRALTSGTSLNHVNIKLPPLPEQNRIVSVLETWDKYIEKLAQKIEVKKQIKKGLMQDLLTGKKRLSGFGGKWETVEIGELLNYEQPTKYIVTHTDYCDDHKTPVLTANKRFILGYTDEIDGIYINTPVIIFDDFTMDNKFVDFEFKIKSSAIKILTPKNKDVNLKFIFEKIQLINVVIGEHRRHYLSEYQYLTIDTPDIKEQNAIGKILTTADKEITELEKKLSIIKDQKKYLLNNLITGAIRTPETLSAKLNS